MDGGTYVHLESCEIDQLELSIVFVVELIRDSHGCYTEISFTQRDGYCVETFK